MEVLDALCDPDEGILRSKKLDARSAAAIQTYWSYQWITLKVVFRQTEQWSNELHDKPMMTEICRDTMQYADTLFEQYNLFYGILSRTRPERAADYPKLLLDASDSEYGSPVKALECMAMWLRLRDDYLAQTFGQHRHENARPTEDQRRYHRKRRLDFCRERSDWQWTKERFAPIYQSSRRLTWHVLSRTITVECFELLLRNSQLYWTGLILLRVDRRPQRPRTIVLRRWTRCQSDLEMYIRRLRRRRR